MQPSNGDFEVRVSKTTKNGLAETKLCDSISYTACRFESLGGVVWIPNMHRNPAFDTTASTMLKMHGRR